MTTKWITTLILCLLSLCTHAQKNEHHGGTYVDEKGVIRWHHDQSEVYGFGVNYSLPFAHAYRMASRLGVSPEDAIQQDVYHWARLDLDLYRVHVWDTEISDTLGNLLNNDHLRLFDYAINEMKKRGMKFVITPIAFWGNGWPEPDEDTPGFSNKYGKPNCLTNPEAIKAQENYLFQFLNHVNLFTGIAYKDEKDILAFEISNEPHHQGSKEEVTQYINRMVNAIRKTGTNTPVFYNLSHSTHLADAYFNADIDGGTFQWYPTGLVANHQINGNYLPHVANYPLPYTQKERFQKMARIIYEFDAADVGGSYIYPAMARSFREAGFQTATHFDYDAMFLAPYNTNYGTHYMSLPYAPQKALSLKIASAVFHDIPRNSNFGTYPDNNRFGYFRVDYENNLAELVSDTRFFYTNHTLSQPENPDRLAEIAGYGNSPIVEYDGTGAYFLDQIEKGVWRLEVMPDALWTEDPFSRISPRKQVAAVLHHQHSMRINLPTLGRDFMVRAVNSGNSYSTNTITGSFTIRPGVFLLYNEKNKPKITANTKYKNIQIGEFVAPESNLNTIVVKNLSAEDFTAGEPALIQFDVFAPVEPQKVEVWFQGSLRMKHIEVSLQHRFTYQATIPGNLTGQGIASYYILVESNGETMTFPAAKAGEPLNWDFHERNAYTARFLSPKEPILLWSAGRDWDQSLKLWNKQIRLIPGYKNGSDAVMYNRPEFTPVIEHADTLYLHTFKHFFASQVKGRKNELPQKKNLVIVAENPDKESIQMEIGLTDTEGRVYSGKVSITQGKDVYRISLSELTPGKFVILPRPFPEFFPYYATFTHQEPFAAIKAETLQVTVIQKHNNQKIRLLLKNIRFE